MNMRRLEHIPVSRSGRYQQGISMLMTLVALTVLMISAVAMVRSFGGSTLLATGLSFKRSALSSAEIGVDQAQYWFKTGQVLNTLSNRYTNQLAQNYFATQLASDSRGVPTVLLNDTAWAGAGLSGSDISAANNETVRYVIDRQCSSTGTPDSSFCLYMPVKPKADEKGTYNLKKVGSGQAVVYRVTVRVKDLTTGGVTFSQSTFIY